MDIEIEKAFSEIDHLSINMIDSEKIYFELGFKSCKTIIESELKNFIKKIKDNKYEPDKLLIYIERFEKEIGMTKEEKEIYNK